MKKALSFIFVLALCLSLCACGGSGKSDNKINDSDQAIRAAQNDDYIQYAIARKAGLKFYSIDWGTCTAKLVDKGGDKYWKVTLKGNVSGYTDDQKTNRKYAIGFTQEAYVYANGKVRYS